MRTTLAFLPSRGDEANALGVSRTGEIGLPERESVVSDETIDLMRHVYECPMRWADLDLLQHVNNVTYGDYLQDARVDFLRTVAPGLRAEAVGDAEEALVVVSHDLSYLAPLALHPSVDVECWVSQVRAASFTISYEIVSRSGEQRVVHAQASTVLTPFVFAEQRPRRFSAQERALLQGLVVEGETPEPVTFGESTTAPVDTYDVHVRFSDVDAYGHVNNVIYLEYFQEARIAYMSSLRNRLPESDRLAMVVARTKLGYVRQMVHRPETYTARTWVSRVGGRSLVVQSEILDGDEVMARAEVVLVFFDPKTQRSVAPSDEMRAALLEVSAEAAQR